MSLSFKDYFTEMKSLGKQIDCYQAVVSMENQPETLSAYFPHLVNDTDICFLKQSKVDLEDFSDSDAERIVDKGFEFLKKLLKALFKLSIALWKKLWGLHKHLGKFLFIAAKRADSVKESLLLGLTEGLKIFNYIKERTREYVLAGQTHIPHLPDWVNLIKASANIKSDPVDSYNPASVLQWLESMQAPRLSFKRIEGLKYNLSEKYWPIYQYHQRHAWLSKELLDFQTKMNNYYYKIIQETTEYLGSIRFITVVQQCIGKYQHRDFNKAEFILDVVLTLLDPFFKTNQPYLQGNISHERRVVLNPSSINKLFHASKHPVQGFEQALLGLLPEVTVAEKNEFQPYREDTTTTVDHLAKYATELKGVIKNIEMNQRQLMERNEQIKDGFLITESELFRILKALPHMEEKLLIDTGTAIMELVRKIDNVVNRYYSFHIQLSSYQLKGLDMQLNNMKEFMPYI